MPSLGRLDKAGSVEVPGHAGVSRVETGPVREPNYLEVDWTPESGVPRASSVPSAPVEKPRTSVSDHIANLLRRLP